MLILIIIYKKFKIWSENFPNFLFWSCQQPPPLPICKSPPWIVISILRLPLLISSVIYNETKIWNIYYSLPYTKPIISVPFACHSACHSKFLAIFQYLLRSKFVFFGKWKKLTKYKEKWLKSNSSKHTVQFVKLTPYFLSPICISIKGWSLNVLI